MEALNTIHDILCSPIHSFTDNFIHASVLQAHRSQQDVQPSKGCSQEIEQRAPDAEGDHCSCRISGLKIFIYISVIAKSFESLQVVQGIDMHTHTLSHCFTRNTVLNRKKQTHLCVH